MKLDINENNLILDIPKKYYLDMKLSYPVFPEKGNAKYDSKTKKLKINLVVDQSKIVEKIEEAPKIIEEIPEKVDQNEKKEETNPEEKENAIEIKPKNQEKEEDVNINNENENEEKNNDNLLEFHEQNYYLKMKESPKKTQNVINDIEEKVFVEEIENNENKQSTKEKNEQKTIENKIKIPTKLQFKTQETAQKYFLILHIPKYSKSDCQIRKLSQEVH